MNERVILTSDEQLFELSKIFDFIEEKDWSCHSETGYETLNTLLNIAHENQQMLLIVPVQGKRVTYTVFDFKFKSNPFKILQKASLLKGLSKSEILSMFEVNLVGSDSVDLSRDIGKDNFDLLLAAHLLNNARTPLIIAPSEKCLSLYYLNQNNVVVKTGAELTEILQKTL